MSTACAYLYFKKFILGGLMASCLISIPSWAYAVTSNNTASLQWAANTEPDLAGYKVYHGTAPGVYGSSLNVGKATTYQFPNLESNKVHYFSVTAYDTSGNESSPAPEVSKAITEKAGMILSVSLTGNGNISSTPSGLICSSGTCSGTFTEGTSVTLVALPTSGYNFTGWGGVCSGTGSCAVTLSSSKSVSATFSAIPAPVFKTLSISLTGDGGGTIVSSPAGLTCSTGTCSASFLLGTTVSLSATSQSDSTFTGWNGGCSGTSSCSVSLGSSQTLAATFTKKIPEASKLSKPTMPILVNFQPSTSEAPSGFKKDDGSLFNNERGYGWSQLLNGVQRSAGATQASNTWVGAFNWKPATWNMTLPNGTYFLTMVLGDSERAKGPHWLAVEGLQLTKQVNTNPGEYLTIVDYPVEVKDNTLSLRLGGESQGETLINFLIINSTADHSLANKVVSENLGSNLVSPFLVAGGATIVNPDLLVKLDQEEEARKQKELELVAAAEAKRQAELVAAAEAKRQAELVAAAEAKRQAELVAAAEAKRQAELVAAAEAKRQAELVAA
ncbi:MAG: hypothetical protein AB7T38_18115, partial [Nitrospirales bacterium]